MNVRRSVALGAAVVALGALGACGSGDGEEGGPSRKGGGALPGGVGAQGGAGGDTPEGGDPLGGGGALAGSDGDGTAGQPGALPRAGNTASIAAYLNSYVSCGSATPGPQYDASEAPAAWGREEAADESWAIAQRGVCRDGNGRPIALLAVDDMKKFQTAARRDGGGGFLVGQDFAVVPVGDSTIRRLEPSPLMFLNCEPDFTVPDGYTKQPGRVDGCVVTDYLPAD
ncbi:hypothetical protein [Streptomyces qinglanensis]|uniref:Lipoprotein n=1 Tax=Streptomyces qinglanensis TaxID=943816 RepID=A0A1H9V618_9ACTN|nr:hypothetical protein [Streptomyces qinglanensis]SES17009.1 hypothetical protein SAMN05421870_110178 [Streptomyces qinglanensis]